MAIEAVNPLRPIGPHRPDVEASLGRHPSEDA
jgi:hypothetical protein